MHLEFNGEKLLGLTVSDIDLEIRTGLEAKLEKEGRKPTNAEIEAAWIVVSEQIKILSQSL